MFEMLIFVGILILGLVYVWRKGDLDWIKPTPVVPKVDTNIPSSVYEKLNLEQSAFTIRPFEAEKAQPEAAPQPVGEAVTSPNPVRKPMFKPTFKKPANDTGNE
jgi:NADH-quinone oxidoreductase subunit A